MDMPKTDEHIQLDARPCFGTYRLNRAFARFYQSLFGDTGLTYPKFVILSVLAEFGPQSITELSDRAGVETNTLSPLLKRMAEFGVINRQRDEKDERRMVVSLTDLGGVLLEAATAAVNEGFRQLNLDPDEVASALTFISSVEERLDATAPEAMQIPQTPASS